MNKNFVEELKWRGMLSQIMPGTEELLMKEQVTAYLGTVAATNRWPSSAELPA